MLPPLLTTRLPLTTIAKEREKSAAVAFDDERESIFALIAGDKDKRETREVGNILLSHSVIFA